MGTMDYQITGSKLSFQRNCLSVLFYNLRIVKLYLHESAALVIDEYLRMLMNARFTLAISVRSDHGHRTYYQLRSSHGQVRSSLDRSMHDPDRRGHELFDRDHLV
jgi:hypothetical protein